MRTPAVLEDELVVRADGFATSRHAGVGQLQPYTGLDYSSHTRAVAALLARYIDDPEVVAAGHLHDVIEDTGTTRDELEAEFTPRVARLVDAVSTKTKKEMGSRAARVAHEVARLHDVEPDAKSIKCSDVSINMNDIVERDPKFARVYVPEKRLLLPSLVGAHLELFSLAESLVFAAEAKLQALSRRPGARAVRP